MMKKILEEAKRISEQIVEDRRQLHQMPELGLDLPRTKAYVVKRLKEMGYVPQEIGKSGITVLAGGKIPGKVFLLRADMDALPIKEETGLPFASRSDNMHACGHDTHTAMLLGAARILKDREDEIQGTVKLFFQPGEEILAGAKEAVDAGLLHNPKVDAAMMVHILSGLDGPTGVIGILGDGACYASCDWFRVDIQGKGGHGAVPESTVSPINIASAINAAIQEIMAMVVPPAQRAVMTVGEMHSGNAGNIIPDSAYMIGTIRTFDEGVRSLIKEKLVKVSESIAVSRGGSAKVAFSQSTPAAINDPKMREMALASLAELLGPEGVVDMEKVFDGAFARVSGSEDFAYIAEKVPSLVSFLFAGNHKEGFTYFSHHPRTDFKEDYFYVGAASYAQIAMDWLIKNR